MLEVGGAVARDDFRRHADARSASCSKLMSNGLAPAACCRSARLQVDVEIDQRTPRIPPSAPG
jgi:hypothetical protein